MSHFNTVVVTILKILSQQSSYLAPGISQINVYLKNSLTLGVLSIFEFLQIESESPCVWPVLIITGNTKFELIAFFWNIHTERYYATSYVCNILKLVQTGTDLLLGITILHCHFCSLYVDDHDTLVVSSCFILRHLD